jgi:hypothetical protein
VEDHPVIDQANGLFELLGAALVWLNVRALYKAKEFRGVAITPMLFFASWSVFNTVLYYPALTQWWSFVGSLNMTIANVTYGIMMLVYARRAREEARLAELRMVHSIVKSRMDRWSHRWG